MIEKLEQYNNLLEVCLILEFFAISLWSILHGCNLTMTLFGLCCCFSYPIIFFTYVLAIFLSFGTSPLLFVVWLYTVVLFFSNLVGLLFLDSCDWLINKLI